MDTERISIGAPRGEPTSETSSGLGSLCRAMESLHGYATFASLSDIHKIACERFGFQGSLADAAEVLQGAPDIIVEVTPRLEDVRVKSSLWHPNHTTGQ